MLGIYRMVSRKIGQKVLEIHLPPGADGKKGDDLLKAVFDRFVVSGWGRYTSSPSGEDKYTVTVNYFWLGEALKGIDKKPMCSLMEGILGTLFSRAYDRSAKVTETKCVAIGDAADVFEVSLG